MNKLREIRARKKITQFRLRLMTGIHQSKLSLAENGYIELSAQEKRKIAKALSVQTDEIWRPARRNS